MAEEDIVHVGTNSEGLYRILPLRCLNFAWTTGKHFHFRAAMGLLLNLSDSFQHCSVRKEKKIFTNSQKKNGKPVNISTLNIVSLIFTMELFDDISNREFSRPSVQHWGSQSIAQRVMLRLVQSERPANVTTALYEIHVCVLSGW